MTTKKYIFAILLLCIAIPFLSCKKEKYEGELYTETPLNAFVQLSDDSVYLVFLFVYSCPHCQNSVENLNEYEQSGVVDKVIGLTIQDSVAARYFTDNFYPDFTIIQCDIEEFFAFNNRFPTSLLIKKGKIEKVLRGELPTATDFYRKNKRKIEQCEE
ncbi:MAG: hypothetical protein LBN23_07965 [Paludibacter sp.]|jgi:hypothetical protein|nr:hypothetical protein [Paludibacter sp.]